VRRLPPGGLSALRPAALGALAAMLVIACGGRGIDDSPGPVPPPGGVADCGQTRLKSVVLDTARQWYLFPELLPANIDPAPFANVGQFLDALTAQARAEGKDRFFSGTTSIAIENQLLQGQTAGFGFTLLERAAPAGVAVAQVFAGSAAAEAGFGRGDQLLAIGTSVATLQPIGEVLASAGGLEQAIGPSTAGVARALRWRSLAGVERTATLTKRSFDIDAVPDANLRVLALADGTRVGHLTFRSFVSDTVGAGQVANLAALRNAFARFRSEGVRNVIVDLRYNGGGLVSIAELLLNLLAGDQAGQVAFETRYNAQQASRLEVTRLAAQPQTVPALRVAFVVTDRSASASEQVVNSMLPYARTAIIGTRTFGKPVGQLAFDIAACDFRLRLVAFRTVNRNGDGDYYTGLPYPGFTRAGGVACVASDDLTRQPGDPQERMTAEALAWIGSPTGQCSAGAIATGAADGQLPGIAALETMLLPAAGGEALQYYLPGTF
jgi:C-terminal processing protease CtpA/Prc